MKKKRRINVEAEHHGNTGSEVINISIDAGGKYSLIIEHLNSRDCIVIDLVYPDGSRTRLEELYYGDFS